MIKHFNRFELKYIITAAQARALAEALAPRMRTDPEGNARGEYAVTSIYFDTADQAFFRAKIDGLKFRRKLRIRRYGTLEDSPLMSVTAEIKQRISRTTQKRRIALSYADAQNLCRGSIPPSLTDDSPSLDNAVDRQVASEIAFLARALHLRPTATVGYTRKALIGSLYEPGLRITFDQLLWCRPPSWGLGTQGPRFPIIPADRIILEVKVNDAIPLWVSTLLAAHDCGLSRFSKYCSAWQKLQSPEVRTALATQAAL